MSYGVSHRRGFDLVLLWLWHRPGAVAPIRPLAWEPPYAAGTAQEIAKRQKQTNKKKTKTKNKKQQKKELPYDTTIPLLGIYPDKTLLKRDTCTRMFIAALFSIAKTWKQPKCPSTDDWIRKMWYIYTMEYYSAIKKNDIMPFAATWMELENLILSEMSQKDKDKYHMISLITGI